MTRPMWECSGCNRRFANRNQTHTCAPVQDLDRHFDGRDPLVRACFDRVLALARSDGELIVLPERTRVALQVRMSFAAFTARNRWPDGHVVLARELSSPSARSRSTAPATCCTRSACTIPTRSTTR